MQFLMMGCYQLSRVYYCFANEQIHSNKGYPRWLFITMYITGVLLCTNVLISGTFFLPQGVFVYDCGFTNNLQFYYYPIKYSHRNAVEILIWFVIAGIGYLLWDLFILFMYICKMIQFRRFQNDSAELTIVYKRIMNNLNKIAILTLFYEITGVYMLITIAIFVIIFKDQLVVDIVRAITTCGPSLAVSYSMYLMMDHNKKQYVMFLEYIHKLRLYWLCCCCGHLVLDQLNGMEDENKFSGEKKLDADTNEYSTKCETKDISNDDYKIKTNGNELSIDTTVGSESEIKIQIRNNV